MHSWLHDLQLLVVDDLHVVCWEETVGSSGSQSLAQYSAVQRSTAQYSAVQRSTVQYSAAQWSLPAWHDLLCKLITWYFLQCLPRYQRGAAEPIFAGLPGSRSDYSPKLAKTPKAIQILPIWRGGLKEEERCLGDGDGSDS